MDQYIELEDQLNRRLLAGCDDPDLYLILRMGEARFHAGPGGRLPVRHPGIPDRVHFVVVADVGEPDGGHQDFALAGAGLPEVLVDFVEYALGLRRNLLRHRLVGDDAG